MNLEDPVISKPWIKQTSADDFAEEIESEDADTRTLIARTAQLWSAVNQTKHADDNSRGPPLCCSASAWHMSLSEQHGCAEDGNSTLDSDDEEYGEGDECIKMESVDMVLQSMTRAGNYLAGDVHPSWPTVEQACVEDKANGMGSDNGYESEGSEDFSNDTAWECGKLQLEQGDDTLNRATNTSKARAIINAMLINLIRLGFREDITRTALEAGAFEIDHYDSDCDLAYEDIFMLLVKMVCDAHVDMSGGDNVEQSWKSQERNSGSLVQTDIVDAKSPSNLNQLSFLPSKWPVFDMAQFEFESARPGTCFNSVCVLTNLPLVSMDRTEELVNVLSCNLFCMIGDPIQVVIPSTSSTGRTKGHAFLEFDGPDVAQKCALAVDGLTWGKGSLGRIRGNLFRQYQMESPAAGDRRASIISGDRASIPSSLVSVPGSGSLLDATAVPFLTSGHHDNLTVERFRPDLGIAQQQPFICDSDEDDSDSGEWVCRRPLNHEQFSPSPLSHLSSGSAGSSEQYEPIQYDIAMQFGWDDKASDDEYSVQQKRKVEDDNENDTSFDCNSVLEFQGSDEEEFMGHSFCKELVREYPPTRVTLSLGEVTATRSTVISTAPAVALESHADCDMAMQSWDVDEGNDIDNKLWRHYCEDLSLRNCEMQEQISFARRRIVQLSHNNQKLHLLIDRVERDRDRLLLENNVLQTQLHEHEDHEQHHDSLMKELIVLRKRVTEQEHSFDRRTPDPLQQHKAACNVRSSFSYGIRAALSKVASVSLTNCKMEELKEWEQQLESTLSHVRSIKEEKALEVQKKLDRQVEEQNELKLCVICLSNEKSILCLPCRHLCLCKTCSYRQEVTKCPICRLEIEEMLAVYS
ncbi:unnamed protein product [Peronospora farinosa]|uniref:RING-type domain-containing protein n=1 Tax=Peronospora farinosa TaxID=134698 RepID=A0ABN8BXM7_9STRA|nr:unnamed protein product [Peronospora farinosa]